MIAPAGRPDSESLTTTIQTLRAMGFAVAQFREGRRDSTIPAFSASDSYRAEELAWALTEPGIKAVFCARAGYGTLRTLHDLQKNTKLISRLRQAVPRFVLGYSDCTYLHQWIQNQLHWISFHGPLVGFLKGPDLKVVIDSVMSIPEKSDQLRLGSVSVIQRGRDVSGRLVGGTLSLLSTVGSCRLPSEPVILCLEDVNEDHYRLDRLIWSLIDAGYGRHVRGVVLGTFSDCGFRDRKKFPWKTVLESLKALSAGPIIQAKTFGHGLKRQVLLPLGCRARLSSAGRLVVLESQLKSERG